MVSPSDGPERAGRTERGTPGGPERGSAATGLADSRRFVFVTGKGGTGKTTVSAALALSLAARGRRVLIATSSAQHRLSELLGVRPFTPEIQHGARSKQKKNLLYRASARRACAARGVLWSLRYRIQLLSIYCSLAEHLYVLFGTSRAASCI